MKRLAAVVAATLLLAGCTRTSGRDNGDAGGSPPPIGTADCPAPAELLGAHERPAGDDDDEVLPDLTLPCLGSDRTVALRAIGRTPTVVNLWASWCGPCRKEMPAYQKVHTALGDRVRFLGVNTRDFDTPARRTIQNTGISYPSVVDKDEKVRRALDAVGMPVTVLVGADGRIRFKHIGELTEAELRAAIAKHLGVA